MYVAFVVSPGYHNQTEHRVALIDAEPIVNAEFEQLIPYLSATGWIAAFTVARDRAKQRAAEHECSIKEYHFDESFYSVRKRMQKADL